jgi:predicted DNA-binding protein with PD1-like motif
VKAKRVRAAPAEAWALVFAPGDEAVGVLGEFARERGFPAGSFTALGAFAAARVAWFNLDTREYEEIAVPEQVEVLSLVGDLALRDGRPFVHAHAVLGRRDGTVLGGHLLAGTVRPTLELFLHVYPEPLRRVPDAESGLALIDPDA